jgi:N4-gp56 family major capsid protein
MITTTTQIPPEILNSLSGKMLSVPQPNLIHNLFLVQDKKPKGSGYIHRFRRFAKIGHALTPLGNMGIEPPAQTLSAVDIDATLQFYGTWIAINEQVPLTLDSKPLNIAAQRLGISLRETQDILTRNVLMASASQVNAVGGFNGDNPTEITRADVDGIIRTLKSNDAKTLADDILGADRFGSGPIRASYVALGHTDLCGSLDTVQGFVHTSQYPSDSKLASSEWGAIGNSRYFLSSQGARRPNASLNGAHVYPVIYMGIEAAATIEQDLYTAQYIYTPASIAGGPLHMNSTAGYKFSHATVVLNEQWLVTLNVTL